MRKKKLLAFLQNLTLSILALSKEKKQTLPSSQVARFFYVSKMSLEYIDLRKWKEKKKHLKNDICAFLATILHLCLDANGFNFDFISQIPPKPKINGRTSFITPDFYRKNLIRFRRTAFPR